ncbi:MAG TPA: GGDEF domain-containing protein [Devosiaceae bacterium]|jgi:diguanylate cyclase (GGDEF)-like protein
MRAAIFILAINVFTAGVFSACFVIAYRRKSLHRGENWLALGFGLVALYGVLEFIQPLLADSELLNFVVFMTYLAAMTAMVAGLARRFALAIPPGVFVGMIALGVPVYLILLGLGRGDPVRPLLYQAPFVLVQLVGCLIIWRGARNWINGLLLMAFAVSAAIFAGKPFLAAALGIGHDTVAFLGSDYSTFSQTFETFFLISTGVLLAIAVAWDMLVEITLRSETDKLSGLLNRRGFEMHCDRMMAGAGRSDVPLVLIMADLDHFKDINDSFGHAVGDQVIAAFAQVLKSSAPSANQALVGRLGGEEFGVLLSGTVVEGRNYGESARKAFASLKFEDIAPHGVFTASFGIAEFQRGEPLSKFMSRADSALYEAKHNGRNQVHVAHTLSVVQEGSAHVLKHVGDAG